MDAEMAYVSNGGRGRLLLALVSGYCYAKGNERTAIRRDLIAMPTKM